MAKGIFAYFDIETGYYPGLHHGLAYLMGAVSKNNDINFIHIYNEKHLDIIEEKIKSGEKYDFLAISFTTNQRKYLWRFFEKKIAFENLFIIGGGVHPTLDKENTFNEFPQFDGICVGEGETSFVTLCESIDKNRDVYDTPSFIFKRNINNKITFQKNAVGDLVHIDDLPKPDYTVFDYKKIIKDSGDVFAMMLGRGCPYRCTYCASAHLWKEYPNPENYVRFPSIDRSIEMIKENLNLYPDTKSIIFADDTFTVKKDWLSEFCIKYKDEINLPFECNARVETVSDKVCESLKYGGCTSVDFGVESGSEWLRNNIVNRKHKNKVIIDAFSKIKEYNIKGFSYNIVGMPFESAKMMRETYNLNKKYLVSARYGRAFYYYPYPGTGMHDLSIKYKLLRSGIENLSGYLEAPTVIEYHSKHKEIRKWFKKINLLFASRLVFDRIKVPEALSEKIFIPILQLMWPIFGEIVEPDKNNQFMINLNKRIKLIFKKFKPGHSIYNSHDSRKVEPTSGTSWKPY